MNCHCTEIYLDLYLVPGLTREGLALTHDCSYVRDRNALIPAAEEAAARAVQGIEDRTRRGDVWTKAFADEMTRLAEPLTRRRVLRDETECNVLDDAGYICTLPVGHEPWHEAWGYSDLVRTWRV